MKLKLIVSALGILTLAACSSKAPAPAQQKNSDPAMQSIKSDIRNKVVEFQCAKNKGVRLTFVGQNTDNATLVVSTKGVEAAPSILAREKAASGMAYGNSHFKWRSKGTEGFLQEPSGKKSWKTTYDTCWVSNISFVYPQ